MRKPLKKVHTSSNLKPPARPRRPTDPNRAAHAMMAEHMARVEPEPTLDFQAQYKAHMAKLGAKGGKKGGKRRLETITAERRSEIALNAAQARWVKERARRSDEKRSTLDVANEKSRKV